MEIPLGEVVYFDVVTSNHSTGAVQDADSTPTFEVFEEATDTDVGVGGSLTKRTDKTGNYRGTFTASATNGFELGKWYSVIVSATVAGVSGKTLARNFRLVAAETSAGYPEVRAVASGHSRTWYVASTGASGNDGKTWATAKALLSQAVGVADSGDLILIGPGTFAEASGVDMSGKDLIVRGCGTRTKITQSVSQKTITVGNRSLIEDLWVENTRNTGVSDSAYAIRGDDVVHTTIRRVRATAPGGTGIAFLGSAGASEGNAVVECAVDSAEYGIINGGVSALIDGCVAITDNWTTCASSAVYLRYNGVSSDQAKGVVRNTIGIVRQASAAANWYAAGFEASYQNVDVYACVFAAAPASNSPAYAIRTDSPLRVHNSYLSAATTNGSNYDVFTTIASAAVDMINSVYDPTKISGSGTVANRIQASADAALAANNLDHLMKAAVASSDVTNNSALAKLVSKSATAAWSSYNNTTDSLEARADTPVSLTSAYDAAKTAAAPGAAMTLTSAYDAAKTAAQVGSAMTLATAERDAVADALLSRSVSAIEASAAEHSLCTVVLATLESSISGSMWTIKRTDGGTTHVTKTVTGDADALPITGVS